MGNQSLGWTGNIFFLLGAILLALACEYGFLANCSANSCYLIRSYRMRDTSLFCLSLALIVINFYGWLNWT